MNEAQAVEQLSKWVSKDNRIIEIRRHSHGVRVTLKDHYYEVATAVGSFTEAVAEAMADSENGLKNVQMKRMDAAAAEVKRAQKELEQRIRNFELAKQGKDF